MTMNQLLSDLPVMLALFVTVALGYAVARWLERRATPTTLKIKKVMDDDNDGERQVLPADATTASTNATKARAEARRRAKRTAKAAAILAQPEAVVEASVPVQTAESDASIVVATDNNNAVNTEASTDTSPTWARVEKLKEKKAMKKARKADAALQTAPAPEVDNASKLLGEETVTAEVYEDDTNTGCDNFPTAQEDRIEEAPLRENDQVRVPHDVDAHDIMNQVLQSPCAPVLLDSASQLGQLIELVSDENVANRCMDAKNSRVGEDYKATICGATWGDFEDSECGDGDNFPKFGGAYEDHYSDSCETTVGTHDSNDSFSAARADDWDESAGKSKTWWNSKCESWDDEPAAPLDDWMKPFDDIIASQASKAQCDAPEPPTDGWEFGLDDMQQEAAYAEMHQMEGMAMQQYPSADCQPPLYTDGENVYMMMCVEVPDSGMNLELPCGAVPSGMQSSGAPLCESKDAADDGYHTDEERYAVGTMETSSQFFSWA